LYLCKISIEPLVSDGNLRSCFLGRGGLGGSSDTRRDSRVAAFRRIRVCNWNVGSLTGKLLELVDALERLKVDIACFQETKWKGFSNREANGYKLCAYAPQVGLSKVEKTTFWDSLDKVMRECPTSQRLILGGDLNGHIGAATKGYTGVHGGFGYGARNEEGRAVLDFATAHDLGIVNSHFKKRDHHLITFQSEGCCTQINYLLVRRGDLKACKDYRVFPREACSSQHNLLALDILFKRVQYRREGSALPRILWKNLMGMQQRSSDIELQRLFLLRITKARERRKRDLGDICFIKDEEGRTITDEAKIKKRWSEYFSSLFNAKEPEGHEEGVGPNKEPHTECYYSRISQAEIRTALQKMVKNKAVGPDQIPIEAWKSLRDEGTFWITSLFNKIFTSAEMPEE
nr:craniofacial development protein 2-like [Tanacetum cinerariifolium]